MFTNPNDLTFKDLTDEEKGLLLLAHHEGIPIEHKRPLILNDQFRVVGNPEWHDEIIYRVIPEKPSINWSHVHVRYNYLAIDNSGSTFLYKTKPEINHEGIWGTNDNVHIRANVFASFKLGTCKPEDSLVERP